MVTISVLPVSVLTLTAIGLSELPVLGCETLSRISPGTQRSVQTVTDRYSKHVCSLDTSASGVLDDNARYKSTHLLTYL